MKVTRDTTDFKPVTIVLETKEEVEAVTEAVKSAIALNLNPNGRKGMQMKGLLSLLDRDE